MWKVEIENVQECWDFKSTQYVQASMMNVKKYLKKKDKMSLPLKIITPLPNYYLPEIDISQELTESEALH